MHFCRKSISAEIRPKRTLGLTAEKSELSTKADFRTSTGADDDSAPRDRILGSPFVGEQPGFIFYPVHAMLGNHFE